MTSYAYIGRDFLLVDEWNLLMKEFWWNSFLNNSRMCSFGMERWIFLLTIFLIVPVRKRFLSQLLPGKMCCISCFKISVSFSESVWIAIPPLGRVYVCFILIFFEERSLLRFLVSANLFGFISRGILSFSLMFVSFLIVHTKSTEIWSFDKDISSLFVLVFCLLSNWWVKMRSMICLMYFWSVRNQTVWWISLSIN